MWQPPRPSDTAPAVPLGLVERLAFERNILTINETHEWGIPHHACVCLGGALEREQGIEGLDQWY
jgi:hypothetical protein